MVRHPFLNDNMSKILIINSGSSSIKFQMIEMPSHQGLVKGIVDAIGTKHASFSLESYSTKIKECLPFDNHEVGIHYIMYSLLKYHIISSYDEIEGCGHRVAHGGERFNQSVIIDNMVENEIDRLGVLAPMHNPMNLLGYQILKKILQNAVHIAVFDTAFHQTIQEETYLYPIPYQYYQYYHIRKYGFHGTSCHYISLKLRESLGEKASRKVIVCHLGNGASITAIKNGKSIDTSMGLTPLGGIAMGSRSGDLDPSIVEYISQVKGMSVTEVLIELNYKSGLLGLSMKSNDMRVLCDEKRNHDERSQVAIDVYIKRIVDYIGSYYLHLGGLETLVFTAGVGENSAEIRKLIVEAIQGPLNISLNHKKNNNCYDEVNIISHNDSEVTVCVIKTNEEMMIAEDTYRLMKK